MIAPHRRRTAVLAALLASTCLSATPREEQQPPPQAETPEAIELSNHFVVGRARRYRVRSTTTTRVSRQRSDHAMLDRVLADRPTPPVEVSRVTFEEEELCNAVDPEGIADVAYRCLSFSAREEVGEQVVLELDIRGPDEVAEVRDVPKFMSLVALMEAPVRFRIDPEHRIHSVSLPRNLPGLSGQGFVDAYRKSLESRYQAFFPGRPVAPGEQWERELTTGQAFWSAGTVVPEAPLTSVARLVGIEEHRGRRCARIEVELDLEVEPGTILYDSTVTRLIADELTGTSTILFDVESGTPMHESTTVRFRLHRENGTDKTEKTEIPIVLEQVVEASWIGTLDGVGGSR